MEKKIKINGEEIVAKTLTAEQIADLLDKLEGKRPATLAEMLMDSEIPEEAVLVSTGLQSDWFTTDVTPDEIHQVWEAVREANVFLSKMLKRLFAVAAAQQQNRQETSEKTSVG